MDPALYLKLKTLLLLKKKLLLLKKKQSKRRFWVHPINRSRSELGVYDTLIQELRADEDQTRHTLYLRMSPASFDHIVAMITPFIAKQDTIMRKALSPALKLAVTLHHLSEGASHSSIASHYRLGRSTVAGIISDTCIALWTVLQPIYMAPPTGPDQWKEIAKGFEKWNFPHCIGSVDGKHIHLHEPAHAGSNYHNYKGRESIVLLAVVDAGYRFIMVDIGQPGSNSDGGIWEASRIGRGLDNDRVHLPQAEVLPTYVEGGPLPYVFVADEAFPLKPYIMRPFPGRSLDSHAKRVFNYRLSRARRVVENAFGILASRWQLLYRSFRCDPAKGTDLVRAMCVLHNYLRTVNDPAYTPPGFADTVNTDGHVTPGFWRNENTEGPHEGRASRSSTANAVGVRDTLVKYFTSPAGRVDWQDAYLQRR